MRTATSVLSAALLGGCLSFCVLTAAVAQTAQQPSNTQQQADPAAEANKRAIEEFIEANKLPGAASKPECVWLGRRIASLLFRDDVDTAKRQMEIYDRFGCPADHLRSVFRCVVRQGNIDQKVPESLPRRVHACWLQPDAPPAGMAQ